MPRLHFADANTSHVNERVCPALNLRTHWGVSYSHVRAIIIKRSLVAGGINLAEIPGIPFARSRSSE